MKTLNLKEMEVIEGGRFLGWGWKKEEGSGHIVDYHPNCMNGASVWKEVYTVFGLETPTLGERDRYICL